ncbi:TPA: GNAT family N-acetyltransferase [Candidatus Delongbacteria bacterium]|nr:GNAT family N-acetyltransferase [Candidatus Delongbacteria bacterium]
MKVELRKLTKNDGRDIYDMLQEIGPGENGFVNSGYNITLEQFTEYLDKNINFSEGIGLEEKYVPQTIYWLIVNDKPVGIGKLRHYLNDNLKIVGGHIGYSIRPSERKNGYGNLILQEILKEAQKMNINEVLLTCDEINIPSRKVIEKNNGVLESMENGECKYWIKQK